MFDCTLLLGVKLEHQFGSVPEPGGRFPALACAVGDVSSRNPLAQAWRAALSGMDGTGSSVGLRVEQRTEREETDVVEVAPHLQDHAVGLEMEIVELARQADQAAHEGWPDREAELREELDALYGELASVAERLTDEVGAVAPAPEVRAEPAGADHH
jgi:hypothetical protein